MHFFLFGPIHLYIYARRVRAPARCRRYQFEGVGIVGRSSSAQDAGRGAVAGGVPVLGRASSAVPASPRGGSPHHFEGVQELDPLNMCRASPPQRVQGRGRVQVCRASDVCKCAESRTCASVQSFGRVQTSTYADVCRFADICQDICIQMCKSSHLQQNLQAFAVFAIGHLFASATFCPIFPPHIRQFRHNLPTSTVKVYK